LRDGGAALFPTFWVTTTRSRAMMLFLVRALTTHTKKKVDLSPTPPRASHTGCGW
jgi:hypothetical protein